MTPVDHVPASRWACPSRRCLDDRSAEARCIGKGMDSVAATRAPLSATVRASRGRRTTAPSTRTHERAVCADRPESGRRGVPARGRRRRSVDRKAVVRGPATERGSRRKQGAHDGRQIRVVHMQAAERGLSSDSRGARTDPALPEPLARFRGPLLVSAASGTQIESAPMATKGKWRGLS